MRSPMKRPGHRAGSPPPGRMSDVQTRDPGPDAHPVSLICRDREIPVTKPFVVRVTPEEP